MGRSLGAVVIGGVLVAIVAGCGRESPRTVLEVKRNFAINATRGVDFGLAGRLEADSYDPQTLDLIGVRLDEGKERILRAERAEIIVNAQRDTVMLRLIDVVGADSDRGGIVEVAGVSTGEVELGFDVRP